MDETPRKRSKRVPKPPDWMSDETAEEWSSIAGYLTRKNQLTKENTALLEVYCETYCNWKRIARILIKADVISWKRDSEGRCVDFKASPMLYPFEQFGRTVWKYARELGLYEPEVQRKQSDGEEPEATDEEIMKELLEREFPYNEKNPSP